MLGRCGSSQSAGCHTHEHDVAQNDWGLARALVAAGAKLQSHHMRAAIRGVQDELAAVLVENGALVNGMDVEGRSSLHMAAAEGNADRCCAAAERGRHPTQGQVARNASPSCCHGTQSYFCCCMQLWAGRDAHGDGSRWRPLLRAVEGEYLDVVRVLLKAEPCRVSVGRTRRR